MFLGNPFILDQVLRKGFQLIVLFQLINQLSNVFRVVIDHSVIMCLFHVFQVFYQWVVGL